MLVMPRILNINIIIVSTETDAEGRILAINCLIEKNPVVIINVYAPTKDNKHLQMSFLTELKQMVDKYSDKPLIIGGYL